KPWQVYMDGNMLGEIEVRDGLYELFPNKQQITVLHNDTLRHLAHDGDTITHPIGEAILNKEDLPKKSDIFWERSGALWYQVDNEILRLDLHKKRFKQQLADQGPNRWSTMNRGIGIGPDSTLYVGTQQSLFVKKPGKAFKRINSFGKGKWQSGILGLCIANDRLWLGIEDNSLWSYDLTVSDGIQYHFANKSIKKRLIWTPHQTSNGDIWVGAGEGLMKLDSDSQMLYPFKSLNGFESLAKASVFHFFPHEKGTWLCTSSGLFLVDLEKEKVLARYCDTCKGEFFIPAKVIAHMHEDEDGIFWLATKGQGLIRWNPATKEHESFTSQSTGISHNVLYAVYEDSLNRLWLPSDRGLNCLDKARGTCTIYLKEDGLPHNEFNTISHYKSDDGKLYFGTQNGFISFFPNTIGTEISSATLYLLSCFRINKQTETEANITADVLQQNVVEWHPEDKAIHFNMALLDFDKKGTKDYSYMVEGFHTDWISSQSTEIQIGGLPYGNYTLRFRAKTERSNEWVEYEKQLQLVVNRPFYLQSWFLLLAFLLLALSIFIGVRYNTRRLRRRQVELETIVEERTSEIQKQAEELRVLDQAKSRFFANISHELRTPLTLMLTPISIILDKQHVKADNTTSSQLQTMERNGKSLLNLINEILDLSKMEARKMELSVRHTHFESFLEKVTKPFEQLLSSRNIQFIYDSNIPDNKHAWIDRKKLEKVLNNFLSNAAKYTQSGGKISLIVRYAEGNMTFEVHDSGSGIHPDDLPHVYERYFQSKVEHSERQGGTGIGLALVKEIAHLFEGKTWVESTLGEGSTFFFSWPLKMIEGQHIVEKAEATYIEESPIDAVEGDSTILIVEDNEDMRKLVQDILEPRYSVITAQNGALGLETLKSQDNIDLIISDVMMPEVDGLSMIKQIKATSAWQHIPTIMLTALASEHDKLSALTIGVDDYITKPFSVPELLVRVQNLLFNAQQRKKVNQEEAAPHSVEKESVTTRKEVVDQALLNSVQKLIEDSLPASKPDAESLAAEVSLSPRQLSRKLKLLTGLSTARFIKEVQLKIAREELESGNVLNVSEVAYKCGFEHPSTFSTVFKKRFGKSPREYL
ncbi:MAG: ATP-binding protein, partial [Bacteroidia bacterium]